MDKFAINFFFQQTQIQMKMKFDGKNQNIFYALQRQNLLLHTTICAHIKYVILFCSLLTQSNRYVFSFSRTEQANLIQNKCERLQHVNCAHVFLKSFFPFFHFAN